MTFILRWLAILPLLALVILSALGALAVAGALTGFDVGVAQVEQAQDAAAQAGAAQHTWIDVGLWAGAALFFLIAAIRLMRRTQGFWVWLLGFACYGGRWAYAQGAGALDHVRNLDLNIYRDPQAILANLASTEAQVAVLGVILVIGLFTFIVDAADRAYWDREGG